ncbi:hypothetical protein HS7_05180 [Sulfolobales archaeon HS-7]|nr:hypothetical protein HS7_05180 [Sulfolobales archaeon HS-7]
MITRDNDRHIPVFILNNPFRRIIEDPKEVIKWVKPGMKVLDAGSGPGYYAVRIARRFPNVEVYAVDSDPNSIKALQRINLPNLHSFLASAANMPFIKDESMDFVISKDVLCCTVDHEGVVREIRRVLKSSGIAYISIRVESLSKDPRNVSKKEWERLLSSFKVIEAHNSKFSYKAIVRK